MRVFQLLFFVVLSISAFAAGKPEDVIMNRDREFNQAVAERRLEGWMEFMGDNAVIGLAHNQPIVGRDAIRAAMQTPFSNPNFTLTWEPTHGEVFRGGRVGYTVGRWTRTVKEATGEKVTHGTYYTLWEKKSNGQWMVAGDGGTDDLQ